MIFQLGAMGLRAGTSGGSHGRHGSALLGAVALELGFAPATRCLGSGVGQEGWQDKDVMLSWLWGQALPPERRSATSGQNVAGSGADRSGGFPGALACVEPSRWALAQPSCQHAGGGGGLAVARWGWSLVDATSTHWGFAVPPAPGSDGFLPSFGSPEQPGRFLCVCGVGSWDWPAGCAADVAPGARGAVPGPCRPPAPRCPLAGCCVCAGWRGASAAVCAARELCAVPGSSWAVRERRGRGRWGRRPGRNVKRVYFSPSQLSAP